VESNPEQFQIDVCDQKGNRLIRTSIDSDFNFHVSGGSENKTVGVFPENEWVDISMDIDSDRKSYTLSMNGKPVGENMHFAAPGISERIDFRTGAYRLDYPIQEYKSGAESEPGEDEFRPGEPVGEATVFIREFSTEFLRE
jgi:hypothetical protein